MGAYCNRVTRWRIIDLPVFMYDNESLTWRPCPRSLPWMRKPSRQSSLRRCPLSGSVSNKWNRYGGTKQQTCRSFSWAWVYLLHLGHYIHVAHSSTELEAKNNYPQNNGLAINLSGNISAQQYHTYRIHCLRRPKLWWTCFEHHPGLLQRQCWLVMIQRWTAKLSKSDSRSKHQLSEQ